MKDFALLVSYLGSTAKTKQKIDALANYFAIAHPKDKIWVIALFTGKRPKRLVKTSLLKECCIKSTSIDEWLFNECYHTVGDLAETITLLLPDISNNILPESKPLSFYIDNFLRLADSTDEDKINFILDCWSKFSKEEIFVFNKIITGGFRIGVSQAVITQAISKHTGLNAETVAHCLTGNWNANEIEFDEFFSLAINQNYSKPYPFYLCYALDEELISLGNPNDWFAEWKWDGIRGQLIKRNNALYVWSRGGELLTDKFPEYHVLLNLLPDGIVLDGEIICVEPNEQEIKPLPFSLLQTRIGRKTITKKQLQQAPVSFIAYDLLEHNGIDLREQSLLHRRALLENIISKVNNHVLKISPLVDFNNWDELTLTREKSRVINSEGLMLKLKNSVYEQGRKKGSWIKWKVNPYVIDCVMVYAQKGRGRRSNLYTDYTFAVKNGNELVSFTKAYSGLTDKEIAEVDAFVKKNALEKFGPVRTVKPELVFEIAFEGIALSNRHKSGVALRFPRINRWRKDKTIDEINTLDDLKKLLNQ
ncbi:MAG: ATP-dependent DNA ligase [Bacteroidia bacterium]